MMRPGLLLIGVILVSINPSSSNFSENCGYVNCTPTSIQEYSSNKELLKVTDLLGRETKQTNQPLIYFYNDGTVEKKLTIK